MKTVNDPTRTASIADSILFGEVTADALRAARAHKVVPQLAALTDRALMADDIAYCGAAAKALESAAVEAADALSGAGVDALVLRGIALQRHFPGRDRQFSDIDLALRRVRDLPRALRALERVGYSLGRPVVARRSASGWWAAAALRKPAQGLPHPVYLDLTMPGPGLDVFRHVRLDDAVWDGAERAEVSGRTVPVPSATSLLTVLAVELCEREHVIARDVLDLLHLIDAGADVPTAARQLRGLPVRRGLNLLAEVVARSSSRARLLDGVIRELLAQTAAGSAPPRRSARTASARPSYEYAVSRSAVRRHLRHGAVVYGLPDPDRRLAGLPGSSAHPALGGMTLRTAPIAAADEVAYSLPAAADGAGS
ncbi:nucleotidyltransferase family protein [Kitasatospora sp. NBC_01287]|uniref:nucleotidyltransferase family protein n=1 Tax=Kitasatospora sp. NBC_01287 TaxID=2903573 RepID=UPI002257493D|nr:nucleotidyltransferase family protein [Kitasatospora sp. NBC_01287]MCX4749341.1 nucleotidyltransferase family protein [Kitasatospora sp. NBC_01287]